MRSRVAALLIAGLIALACAASAHASDMQRMMLAPGCYTIAAGSADEVSAYCLDQTRAAPASGALLADTSTALGETVIKLASGKTVGLDEAIRRRLVQIEGLGNQYQLSVRNLTGSPIELCVVGPTVVMGNGETYVGDLRRARAEIEKLVAAGTKAGPGEAAGSSLHAEIQQKIWDQVERAERAENRDLSNAILNGPIFPVRRPPLVVPSAKCASDARRSELCFE